MEVSVEKRAKDLGGMALFEGVRGRVLALFSMT